MSPTHASACSRLIPDGTPKPTAARLYMSGKSESMQSRAWFQVFPGWSVRKIVRTVFHASAHDPVKLIAGSKCKI